MTTTYDPPQPNAALVVGPDDVLVVSFASEMDPREFDSMTDDFNRRYPELKGRLVFVANAEQMAVLRRNDPDIWMTTANIRDKDNGVTK
jgi:hypothetical protein